MRQIVTGYDKDTERINKKKTPVKINKIESIGRTRPDEDGNMSARIMKTVDEMTLMGRDIRVFRGSSEGKRTHRRKHVSKSKEVRDLCTDGELSAPQRLNKEVCLTAIAKHNVILCIIQDHTPTCSCV